MEKNVKIKNNYNKAFTLIELLVAIAILGILAASLLASYTMTQKRAKDTQRKHDLKQIQEALELYYQDNNEYPEEAGFDISTGTENSFTSAEGVVYLRQIPQDPQYPSRNYQYVSGAGQQYKLYASLENNEDDAYRAEGYLGTDCGVGVCTYGVSSPNTTP